MRIAYFLSNYISHRESGRDFIDCLRSLGHDVDVIDGAMGRAALPDQMTAPCRRADIVIIHDDPLNYPILYTACPVLREKYVVAYAVWETPTLPRAYREGIALCDEVWTCSRFSADAMRKEFPAVAVLPHVVKRVAPQREDLAWAKEVTGRDAFLFFSIVDAYNPRKNVAALISAFDAARHSLKKPVRLVLKQYRVILDYSSIPGVISIEGDLSRSKMAALHSVTDAYVSAHHCEAWGLGMSEAMAYGKPVIATAYSGNMEFMDETNSFPVPYSPVNVSERMAGLIPLFRTDMTWAEVDVRAMAQRMRNVAMGRYDPDIPARASAIVKRFGPDGTAAVMASLLEKCGERRKAPAGKNQDYP